MTARAPQCLTENSFYDKRSENSPAVFILADVLRSVKSVKKY